MALWLGDRLNITAYPRGDVGDHPGYIYATVSPHTLFVVGGHCFTNMFPNQGPMRKRKASSHPFDGRPSKFLKLAANAAGVAANAVGRQMARSLTRTRTAVSQSGSAPLTGNFDYKTDYARRRLTRRQRFRFRRARRRKMRMVKFVREVNIGSTHVVRRQVGAYTSAADASGIFSAGLYGLNGTGGEFNNTNDVAGLFQDIDVSSWGNANNPAVAGPQHRLRYHHATMELTISNTASDPGTDVIAEVYYVRGRRPVPSEFGSPGEFYASTFNKQARGSDPDTGTNLGSGELAATQIGVTPFQNSTFCRHFNIYKRQKFRIPYGNEVNLIIHDRRPRTFNMIHARNNATDSRWHGVVVQFQGPPGPNGANPPLAAIPTQIHVMTVKRYRLKFIRDDEPKDAFDQNT